MLFRSFTSAPPVSAAALLCLVIAISDGDTLTVRCCTPGAWRPQRVRVVGIDAPESRQAFGQRARQNLARLCFRQQARLRTLGHDDYGRTLAHVRCQGQDVGTAQVRAGLAWVYAPQAQRYPHLVALQRQQRRQQALPLLVLVDVSGSMERYARLLLAFIHAATARVRVDGQAQRLRREVFAFGTGLTDLGPAFRESDTDAMLQRAGQAIHDFAGGTRLGDSLARLRQQHARRLVGRRTLVLIVSDGLDTGEPEDLARELDWLKHRCRRLLWLNPLLRFDGYEPSARGAAVLHRAADAMLAVHNVTRLQQLAGAIASLMKQ